MIVGTLTASTMLNFPRNTSAVTVGVSEMKRCTLGFAMWVVVALAATRSAHCNVALLVEEPYGLFGTVNPTGHSAIYLNRVCAESPTMLRRCGPDETGVVISRYSGIRRLDWIAIPLLPYLYAVERVQDVPDGLQRLTSRECGENMPRLIWEI